MLCSMCPYETLNQTTMKSHMTRAHQIIPRDTNSPVGQYLKPSKPKHEHQWHYVRQYPKQTYRGVETPKSGKHKFICICGQTKLVKEQTNNEN